MRSPHPLLALCALLVGPPIAEAVTFLNDKG